MRDARCAMLLIMALIVISEDSDRSGETMKLSNYLVVKTDRRNCNLSSLTCGEMREDGEGGEKRQLQ